MSMYTSAAIIAENCEKKGLGLKYQLYNREYLKDQKNIASVSFLVQNYLKRKAEIDDLIKESGLFRKLTNNDIWLARILVVELVLGRKSFKCKDKISKIVYKYKKQLRELGSGMKVENKAIPRYVRINLLKTNLEPVLLHLREKGFIKLDTPKDLNDFYEQVKNLKENEFVLDYHVPALLVFNSKTKLFNFKWVLDGSLILQDKSSCMVSPLLSPHPGSVTLDMCAAPGYKTLHLAIYLQRVGDIISVDRSKERFEALLKLKNTLELTNVHCFNQDAFDDKFGNFNKNDISYIILDPPCSGSGVVRNYDYEDIPNKNCNRLNSLHNLQSKLLRHALTDFPNVRRVVYSTCSLAEEEDEAVIEEFIEPPKGFVLVDLSSFYNGISTGNSRYKCGSFCMKMHPNTEFTNGFFIAMFERTNPKHSLPEKRKKQEKEINENMSSCKKGKINYGNRDQNELPIKGEMVSLENNESLIKKNDSSDSGSESQADHNEVEDYEIISNSRDIKSEGETSFMEEENQSQVSEDDEEEQSDESGESESVDTESDNRINMHEIVQHIQISQPSGFRVRENFNGKCTRDNDKSPTKLQKTCNNFRKNNHLRSGRGRGHISVGRGYFMDSGTRTNRISGRGFNSKKWRGQDR